MRDVARRTGSRKAVAIALKAANLIGNGLYGVDVKESDGQFYIVEVNDNPNLDSGQEDAVLRDELYRRIMESFVRRIESTNRWLVRNSTSLEAQATNR